MAGVFPRSPLAAGGYARGGRPSVARPPAGPLARAPCARWPTFRPSAVVDVRCRLARYLLGCAVPNVSCGRLFSGCALGLGLAPVTSLSRSLRLTARASRPLCSGGVAPSATPYCVWCRMVLRSKVLPAEQIMKKKLLPQPMLYIIVVSL